MATMDHGEAMLAHWQMAADGVSEEAAAFTFEATAAERAEIAALLDLLSLDALSARGTVRRLDAKRVMLEGTVEAQLAQACVITLEPVPSAIFAPMRVEFVPRAELAARLAAAQPDSELPDQPDIEALTDGHMAIGQLAYEHLATAIETYPRAPGAAFEWADRSPASQSQKPNPFAALAGLAGGPPQPKKT